MVQEENIVDKTNNPGETRIKGVGVGWRGKIKRTKTHGKRQEYANVAAAVGWQSGEFIYNVVEFIYH